MNPAPLSTTVHAAPVTRSWSPDELFDALHDCAIVEVDRQGVIVGWSAGAVALFEHTRSEAMGQHIRVLSEPRSAGEPTANTRALSLLGEQSPHLFAKSGLHVRATLTQYPIRTATGDVAGYVNVYRSSIERATPSLAQTLGQAAYAVLTTDTNGTITYVNAEAERLLGYTADELRHNHTPLLFRTTEEVIERAQALSQRLGSAVAANFDACVAWTLTQNRPDERPWTYVRKDGSRLSVLVSTSVLRDVDGQITGYLEVARDLNINDTTEHGHDEPLRVMFATNLDSTFLLDNQGIIVDANLQAETTFGYDRSELVGQQLDTLVPGQANSARPSELTTRELELRRRDGTVFPAEVHNTTYTLRGRTGQICTVRDISAQRAAEVERERLFRLIEYANDFVGMADPTGRILYQNPAANRMLGFDSTADVRGKHVSEMHPPWAAAKIVEHAVPLALRDGSYTHETVLQHRDGTEIPVSQTMVIHRNDKGDVEYGSTIMRDLRGQKQAEALLANVARHVKGMLYQYERTAEGASTFSYASPGAYELCGLSPEQLAADPKSFAATIHPEDVERVFQAVLDSEKDLTPWYVEYRHIGPNGVIRWHRGQSTPERLPDGSTLWHGFISDITEEHLAAEELERSKLQFEQAIAALEHGFAMFDADERLIVCNDAYAQIYRVSDHSRKVRPKYEELIRITSSQNPDLYRWLPQGTTFEQWLEQRLHDFRNNSGQSVQLIGGRWIRIDERKTISGGTVCVRTDITLLKQAEFEALLQQERLQVATRTGGFGVWEWEMADGKITWDERMCELYDYAPEEFPGTYAAWQNRVHPEDIARVEAAFGHAIAERDDFKSRYRIVSRDGTIRHIEAQGACVLDAHGVVVRSVGVNSDITDQVESQDVLKRHAQAAEAASKAKAEFLATMSHEIRTPMNGVIGMTNLLIGTQLDGQQREYVETIRASGESLLSLINNILDFSKMEAGKLALESVPFSLDQAVVQSITLFTSQAESKGIRLIHSLPSESLNVVGDPTRFKQVLMNLVSNALKFTNEGSVEVRVQTQCLSESQAIIELQIADTGIGISPDHLERLGEAFLQADASTTRQYGGTGLGLSISINLIQRMNGSITVTSDLEGGTTFCVRLPLGLSAHLEPTAEPSTRDPVIAKLGRVLVAEDNAVNQRVVGLMLKKLATDVDFAFDGREALNLFMTQQYDCVLMDGQMPEMDGLEATRQMRAFECSMGRQKTPIIALTANALPGDRETFLSAGMDEYLTKPVRSSDLLIALQRVQRRFDA